MSALIRITALAVVLLTATARADDRHTRVVLADADPELRRAIVATLAPWHLEVVVDAVPPADDGSAQLRAETRAARFVVWRQAGELVVFDRERALADRRDAPRGALDPASAAAAALTVKTLMRLPPPPPPSSPVDVRPPSDELDPPVTPITARAEPAIRVQAMLTTRFSRGRELEVGARAGGAATFPLGSALRLGIAGELGTRTPIQHAGFKGAWTDWGVFGLVSWTFAHQRWDLEPYVGAGVMRSQVTGSESMMLTREETATLAITRAGMWVRYRAGAWSFGGSLGADLVPSTRTYTRTSNGSEFFEVPPFALSIGCFAAADLNM